MYTFHLIANAHLDPVWLWDAREGLNEGIQTCRTVLDLMDADPELTFIRGEMAIYEHIEKYDPATFDRIRAYVAEGRWDVVGNTYVQPDTNLPATETFARHFARAGHYFAARFGVRPTIAWAADSFGHSGGLPDILVAAGMQGYAFTRPFPGALPIEKPAFWWEGVGGQRVLACRPAVGWYGSERDEMPRRLEALREAAQKSDLRNIGVFYGVGNHGGGPTRRMLEDIRAWASQHTADVRILHSGLHRLFAALREEIQERGPAFLPVHRGELNFVLRGCYSSVAKFKFRYREAEAKLNRAERAMTLTAALAPASVSPATLSNAWDSLLFNSFHDILPGTSIERAYDDQLAELGSVLHQAQTAEFAALNTLIQRVETTVPLPENDRPSPVAFLVWNPHPYPYRGPLEIEGALDYRPLWNYRETPEGLPVVLRGPDGQPIAFQSVATEHLFSPTLPWRRRVVFPATLPPLGWSVFTLGLDETVSVPTPDTAAFSPELSAISNGLYDIWRDPDGDSIHILRNGELLFGTTGLHLATVRDDWGSWGGMGEEPESVELSDVVDDWAISDLRVQETGPHRSALWVRFTSERSWAEFTFTLFRNRDAVDVAARILWNERSARLKLILPVGTASATFEIPGGSIVRQGPTGEVPGRRWVKAGAVGFASDALYNFDLMSNGVLRATICRASRYAAESRETATDAPYHPAVDAGELRFRFLLTGDLEQLPRLARELEMPPVSLLAPAGSGNLPRSGSMAMLTPDVLSLLALKPAEDGNGVIVRVYNAGEATSGTFVYHGEPHSLGTVPARSLQTFRLAPDTNGDLMVQAVTIQELPTTLAA